MHELSSKSIDCPPPLTSFITLTAIQINIHNNYSSNDTKIKYLSFMSVIRAAVCRSMSRKLSYEKRNAFIITMHSNIWHIRTEIHHIS